MRVSNLVLPDIREALRAESAELSEALADFHPADLAEIVDDLDQDDALTVLRAVPAETAPEIFDYLEPARRVELLGALPLATAAAIAERMAADERTDLFGEISEDLRNALLARMHPEESRETVRLLEYPPNTAGGLMTTEFVAFPARLTAAELLERIRQVAPETESIYTVYLTRDPGERLAGVVSLRDILMNDPDRRAEDFMVENVVTVDAETDQEEVAHAISKYDLISVPVLDAQGRVLGIVTVDDVIDVLEEESTEDIQRIAAVTPTEEAYLASSLRDMLRRRAGWLVVLFFGEMLTASAMSYYEADLERAIVLALFVPLIISSGGNSGSQATSLVIRALAVGELRLQHWARVLSREIATGFALGAMLGVIAFARIAFWPNREHLYGEHYGLVALTVSVSLIGVVAFGTTVGSMLPLILRRVGFDPATASAPFVATLVDVTGLVIYFTTALVILRGTIL
jgi:magnesium transporter